MTKADWGTEMKETLAAAGRAEMALQCLREWLWDNLVGRDVLGAGLPEGASGHLNALEQDLHRVRESAEQTLCRFNSQPISKLLRGLPLTREEYYLCRAMGGDSFTAREAGLSSIDDYELYQLLCYEDDHWIGVINVHLRPRDPHATRVSARWGRPPEECRRRFLRPEQAAFFRDRLPEAYAKFAD